MPAPFIFRTRIRFVDTDASGRIHYTTLFRHFEAAEEEFLRAQGFAYSTLQERKFSYPRVHVEADYVSPLRHDDEVEIEVSVERVGNRSFTLLFRAMANGVEGGRGRIVVVCLDRATQKSAALPEDFAAALRGFALE